MNNNDILIRIRYALNLKDGQMVKIFKLGGITLTEEDVKRLLTKVKEEFGFTDAEDEETMVCTNKMLDAFLNGLIIFKRGPQEQKTESTSQPVTIKRNNVNNIVLKKLKIALSLTAEEVISILNLAGVSLSKGELSAVLRKEGHKNYRECGDRYLRNFLKGLAIQYRMVNK
ncbi:DUF1456 family protein [Turicibacter sp. 1E2]|uniref:DUF1456 family protein n=1 Tax=Turicibacter sp. 1E2 TaxID=2951143 RepID=UPI0021D48E0D|nr:DUF1456 family protein [Turicibacter sp. 1E2]MCU7209809.1 DUF1456 family protein [Turicibacter sp. 1E2]